MTDTLAKWLLEDGDLQADVFDEARKALEGGEVDPAVVGDTLLELAPELLDISIPEILVRAWSRLVSLREYADPEKHPPDEVSLVPLVEHTVRSAHHPKVEVRLGESLVHTVVFDTVVELAIEGATVEVQAGAIRAIRTGTVQGTGTVSVAGQPLVRKETSEIELAGERRFDPPVPIG